MNNDSGNNYAYFLYENTSQTATHIVENLAQSSVQVGYGSAANAAAGNAGAGEVLLPGYAGTAFNKTVQTKNNARSVNTTGGMIFADVWGNWQNAAAITRLQLIPSAGNWDTGSRFTLYGLQ
jgi:hypothetical protein